MSVPGRLDPIAPFAVGAAPSRPPPRRSARRAAPDAGARTSEALDGRRRRRRRVDEPRPEGTARDAAVVSADSPGAPDAPRKAAASEELRDFTCAICLDRPSTLSELAAVSGCTHRFCFDCISTWARTENRCPCCKARFRAVDRVESLPERGRSDGRERGGIGPSPRTSPVNRLVVEDRNQPSGIRMSFAFIEQILAQFSAASAQRGGNSMRGVFGSSGPNFVFSNAGGNPVMTISMAGGATSVQLYLAEEGEGGRPGRGRVRYMRGEAHGGAAGGTGREVVALVRAGPNARAPTGSSPRTLLAGRGARRSPGRAASAGPPGGVLASLPFPSANARSAGAGARRSPGRAASTGPPIGVLGGLGPPNGPSSAASYITAAHARRSPRAAASNPDSLRTLSNNARIPTEVRARGSRRTTRSMTQNLEGSADAPINLDD